MISLALMILTKTTQSGFCVHQHTALVITLKTYSLLLKVLTQAVDLKGLKFSVIGLGDTSYDTYNLAGRNLDSVTFKPKARHCTAQRLRTEYS